MLVDMAGKNDSNQIEYIHDQNVNETGVCKSLEEGNSIMTVAFNLMGFGNQKCAFKKVSQKKCGSVRKK